MLAVQGYYCSQVKFGVCLGRLCFAVAILLFPSLHTAACPMMLRDTPLIILIPAAGYLLAVYMLLLIAQRIQRFSGLPPEDMKRSSTLPPTSST